MSAAGTVRCTGGLNFGSGHPSFAAASVMLLARLGFRLEGTTGPGDRGWAEVVGDPFATGLGALPAGGAVGVQATSATNEQQRSLRAIAPMSGEHSSWH